MLIINWGTYLRWGFIIEDTKSAAGHRDIPMSPDVEECFKTILNSRGVKRVVLHLGLHLLA